MNKVNISCLNVKNLKANLFYPNFLSEISNILYLNEHWLRKSDINIVKNMAKDTNKKILFKSDMEVASKGRPYGGQCWLIDNSFEILESEFLSRYVSYVNLKINGLRIGLIGVYMPFDDSKKKVDSKILFEQTFSHILVLINKLMDRETPIFIMGDFNSDLFRNNRFDKILLEYFNSEDWIALDHLFTQKYEYTYSSMNQGKKNFSNLDHIFSINNNGLKKLRNVQCNIQEDLANMSDHR